jgi:hypothetical protein
LGSDLLSEKKSREKIIHQAHKKRSYPFPVKLWIREFHEIELGQIQSGDYENRRNKPIDELRFTILVAHNHSPA